MQTANAQHFDIKDILARYPAEEPSLIMVLQAIHDKLNFLPCEALKETAEYLKIPVARVFSAATFYKMFSLKPRGRRVIKVCKGTACHVRGAAQVQDEFERWLKIKPGENTPDMEFTLEVVNCVGACAMAPVVIVGEKVYGETKPLQVKEILEKK